MPGDALSLSDGSRIAIIGAGPAGSFFAHFALHFARKKGIDVSVLLLDGKDFIRCGPVGCNMCAGVISETLMHCLEEEQIVLPEERIQRYIRGYWLHGETRDLFLPHPRGERKIVTVFRGNGPRLWDHEGNVSFDDLLLDGVKAAGARLISTSVREIIMPRDSEDKVRLICGKEGERTEIEADLIVGAFGLNTRMIERVTALGFGYHPPHILRAGQMELHLGADVIQHYLGENIHTFLLKADWLSFGSLIPKGDYVTVSVVGKRDIDGRDVVSFLDSPAVRRVLPPATGIIGKGCNCFPKIATTAAKQPFTDRFVIIGDASCFRYYKNGIESAFYTARLAAETAFEQGISRTAFERGYWRAARQSIIRDNLYGRMLFNACDLLSHRAPFADVLVQVGGSGQSTEGVCLRGILWDLFTGNAPYRSIFYRILHPSTPTELMRIMLRTLASERRDEGVTTTIAIAECKVQSAKCKMQSEFNLGPLRRGGTVAIVGGGPGGVSCAITLKRLSHQLGRNIDVVLYEQKTFEERGQYNQCAGVLSPPIQDVLERMLGIPFPHHLVQRTITGYVLHSDTSQIILDGEGEPSQAVRRIAFDRYLLEQAQRTGVRVIHGRVTDTEITPRRVMVYSDRDNTEADVVVGAFSLDDGSCKLFERAAPYRQPSFLETIVTKYHPDLSFLDSFGDRIHAFLPGLKAIEFGAVIAGEEVTADLMDAFLSSPAVRNVLPQDFDLQTVGLDYFKGRFPTHPARHLYGDRYVTIGDASGLLRPFKGKGITSACLTGIRAAETIMKVGISKKAFEAYYERCREVTDDLPYGKVLRWLTVRISDHGLLDPVIDVARRDAHLRTALFNCVSAHKPFKTIFGETVSPGLTLKLVASVGGALLKPNSTFLLS
jgi:flavin-dependent dehydrogenase